MHNQTTPCPRHGAALTYLVVALLLLGACSVSPVVTPTLSPEATAQTDDDLPRVFVLDPQALAGVKARLAAGDRDLTAARTQLLADARKALRAGPFSVVTKAVVPPSGDKHDFISLSQYWWPNPQSANGLPYVRRDGEANPEAKEYSDPKSFDSLVSSLDTLALAYYLTDDQRYADHAVTLLRAWFLDSDTRMNPNLNYGQVTPGTNGDRGNSVLDMRDLAAVIDDIGLLASARAWKAADQRGMREWFGAYLDWLLNSDVGKEEAQSDNNHGTWYDTQVVAIALFLDQGDLAARVVDESVSRRIARQIEPDGRQPLELARTRSWDYSVFNLSALFRLAALSERAGRDLWHVQTADGRGIRKALDWLVPFADGDQAWPYKQIAELDPEALSPLLRQAAAKYPDGGYRALGQRLVGADAASDRINLTVPD